MPETLDYESQTFRDYTHGTEAERLRAERLEPGIVGLYEHGKIFPRWTPEEARKMRDTAAAILHDRNHPANHHGDWSEMSVRSCAFCELHGVRAAMFPDDEHDDEHGPNYTGWERIYVQAGVTIPDAWRPSFAWWLTAEGEKENARYAECLARDVATFGLHDQRGHVRP